jgi:hypothetical protein
MSLSSLFGPESAPPEPPCSCCSRPSECEIWEHPFCYACAGAWHRDATTVGQMGLLDAAVEEMCAAYRAQVKAWVAERKRGAA